MPEKETNMENEKLSSAFIQKYDSLSDSFVVVKNEKQNEESQKRRRFEPFSFFRRNRVMQEENATPIQREVPPVQNVPEQRIETPQRTVNPQPINQSVNLSAQAYNKIKILKSLYECLLEVDPNNSETFNNLISETSIIENTMLAIYQSLSGTNNVPAQNQTAPEMTKMRCRDLDTTEKYIQSTIDTVLSLQRAVNVPDIDRQLTIIGLTLLSQKSKINSLQTGCN